PYVVSLNAGQNQVRSIAVDDEFNVWIATIDGILQKKKDSTSWTSMLTGSDSGPAYAVVEHNAVIWMGTWKGVYVYQNDSLHYITGTVGPISVLCSSAEGIYAL